ncbi:MAG: hypothetical protein IJN39_06040, partial [Clostridia bacterium]|nr:hypothetical protein [Clostridia bacterium]
CIKQKTFLGIVNALSSVINDKDAYDFDLTGGSEMVIAAIGHIFATSDNGNLSIHQYDIKTGDTVFRHPEYEVLKREQSAPKLTVPEIVALHGGKVTARRDELYPNAVKLKGGILKLFGAVKKLPKEWNNFCTVPSEEKFQKDKVHVSKQVENGNYMNACRKIGDALENAGLITDIEIFKKNGKFYYEYTLNCTKDEYFLYEKSGNILEYYTYLAMCECGAYTDVCVSVEMDADGIITTDNTDTTNEIDVMASSGHLPICVSCKNRAVINEYMYEISAVSEAYCGKYAVPVIVSNAKNLPAIEKRAKSMGIALVQNVADKTYEHFKNELKSIINKDADK